MATYHAIYHLGHDANHGPDVLHCHLLCLTSDALKHWPGKVLLQEQQCPQEMGGLGGNVKIRKMLNDNNAPNNGGKIGGDSKGTPKLMLCCLCVEVVIAVSDK